MKIRLGIAAVAAAGAALVTGAAPAFAAGPPVPAGCTFDQATGVETCVTTTSTTTTVGPFSTNGLVPGSTPVGGFSIAPICGSRVVSFSLSNASFPVTTTTTTTTERHGLNGRVFNTSTSTSQSLNGVVAGSYVYCNYVP